MNGCTWSRLTKSGVTLPELGEKNTFMTASSHKERGRQQDGNKRKVSLIRNLPEDDLSDLPSRRKLGHFL